MCSPARCDLMCSALQWASTMHVYRNSLLMQFAPLSCYICVYTKYFTVYCIDEDITRHPTWRGDRRMQDFCLTRWAYGCCVSRYACPIATLPHAGGERSDVSRHSRRILTRHGHLVQALFLRHYHSIAGPWANRLGITEVQLGEALRGVLASRHRHQHERQSMAPRST